MRAEVSVYESIPQRQWHTIIISVPSGDGSSDVLRSIVTKVGKAIGLTRRRRLFVKHTRYDYRGYVLVYQGRGSIAARKRLERAKRLAEKLTAEIPKDAIKPWSLYDRSWPGSLTLAYNTPLLGGRVL